MKSLYTLDEVNTLIAKGDMLLISGTETLLAKLNKGNWIGGTIPYFMSEDGGVITHDKLQVVVLPKEVVGNKIKFYSNEELKNIPKDYFSNGFSYILIPAFSNVHLNFAKDCITYDGLFDRPLVGWISGFDLKDIGKVTAKVMNGATGELSDQKAIVMHLDLVANKIANTNIINLFVQGNGDVITFDQTSFEVDTCMINGEKQNLAEYVAKKNIDTKLPMVANYQGAMINVSFQDVDQATKKVKLYAPVFKGIEYKIANPVANYEKQFEAELTKHKIKPTFSCNCILNFLYANLEGKRTGDVVGPITFGEIAYMLLNQTMVYLTIDDK